MRIAFIEMAGFRGFKDAVRFDFPAGFVVLTGRNGAGKSTVLDAVDFALTGTIDKFAEKRAKGGGLDQHIWWVGDGPAARNFVRLGFVKDDGAEFTLTRSRDNGLEPSIDDIAKQLCTVAVSGEWARTLVQTTLIRDETLASLSMDLPEQARFEAVRAAIGGLTGPDHSDRTGALIKAANAAKADQDQKVAVLQSDLGRTLSAHTEARSAVERQADTAEAEQTIATLAPDLEGTSDLAEKVRRRIADRKQSAQTISELIDVAEALAEEVKYLASDAAAAEMRAAEKELSEAEEALQSAKAELDTAQTLAQAQRDLDRDTTEMIALLEHGGEIGLVEGHCPLCDAVRTDSEFTSSIKRARERLSERGEVAAKVMDVLNSAQEKLTGAKRRAELAQHSKEALQGRNSRAVALEESLRNRLSRYDLQELSGTPDNLRQAALSRQEETAALEHALFVLEASGAHDRVAALEARIGQLRSAIEIETAKLTVAERAVEAAQQIDKAAKTVANQVLTEQFDTVMPLLKELFLRLRPHTDWRDIETDFGGKVRASLNFTVGEGKNPQFLFSSGQRRAAGMAFLLAIHLSRPWAKLQSLLLDDPVQHIDDFRALNLVEVLSSIRRLGRQVIVAVEDPLLADLLCRRLRSTTAQGGHRYDLAMNPNGSAAIEHSTRIVPLPAKILDLAAAS